MNLVKIYANNTSSKVVEMDLPEADKLFNSFGELEDHGAIVVSTAVGIRVLEHIRLDRILHVFVCHGTESGDYEGCAITAIEEAYPLKDCEKVCFVTGNNELAKKFIMDFYCDHSKMFA